MRKLKMLLLPLVAVPLLAAGCRREESVSAAGGAAPQPQAQVQPAPGMAGQGVVDSLALGKSVAEDGTLRETGNTFHQGDPVIASLKTDGLPAGATVLLKWIGPSGQQVSSDELQVPAEPGTMNLAAKDTSTWAPGTYKVEVAVGGASAGSKPFVIGSGTAAAE